MSNVFSARQLEARGVSRSVITGLVRRGQLRRLRRGWYATDGVEGRVASAVASGGRLSCVSALDFHGAWTMPHTDLHIRAAAGTSVTRGMGRRFHWTRERLGDDAVVDDPITALGIAIGCLDLRAAVVVIDSVLNRHILSREIVEGLLTTTPRGRRLLGLCDERAESGIETLARLALRSRNLRLRLQVLIAGVGRVDILIGDRLVLETDGRAWHEDFEMDRSRDRALMARGYLVLRASYRQVLNDWPTIEQQISAIVRRRDHLWRRTLPQGLRRPPRADTHDAQ